MVPSLEGSEKLPEAGLELRATQSPQGQVQEPIHCDGTDPRQSSGAKDTGLVFGEAVTPNAQVAFW